MIITAILIWFHRSFISAIQQNAVLSVMEPNDNSEYAKSISYVASINKMQFCITRNYDCVFVGQKLPQTLESASSLKILWVSNLLKASYQTIYFLNEKALFTNILITPPLQCTGSFSIALNENYKLSRYFETNVMIICNTRFSQLFFQLISNLQDRDSGEQHLSPYDDEFIINEVINMLLLYSKNVNKIKLKNLSKLRMSNLNQNNNFQLNSTLSICHKEPYNELAYQLYAQFLEPRFQYHSPNVTEISLFRRESSNLFASHCRAINGHINQLFLWDIKKEIHILRKSEYNAIPLDKSKSHQDSRGVVIKRGEDVGSVDKNVEMPFSPPLASSATTNHVYESYMSRWQDHCNEHLREGYFSSLDFNSGSDYPPVTEMERYAKIVNFQESYNDAIRHKSHKHRERRLLKVLKEMLIRNVYQLLLEDWTRMTVNFREPNTQVQDSVTKDWYSIICLRRKKWLKWSQRQNATGRSDNEDPTSYGFIDDCVNNLMQNSTLLHSLESKISLSRKSFEEEYFSNNYQSSVDPTTVFYSSSSQRNRKNGEITYENFGPGFAFGKYFEGKRSAIDMSASPSLRNCCEVISTINSCVKAVTKYQSIPIVSWLVATFSSDCDKSSIHSNLSKLLYLRRTRTVAENGTSTLSAWYDQLLAAFIDQGVSFLLQG